MDSLSQIALGSAVSIAAMGRRASVAKAAGWGAVAGTLPDLDVLVDHGDPILNMVLHRGPSHSLLYLALLALPFGAAVAAWHREWALKWRWMLAIGLALVTHPMLDAMTVYGTRLGLPFSPEPYGVGSVFIIDPLYTVPLLIALVVAWRRDRTGARSPRAAALAGLALSTAYLGWGVLAQQHVAEVARRSLEAAGLSSARLLVTPTPFNSLLWRVVAIDGDRFDEGYRSLLDRTPTMQFTGRPRGEVLQVELPPTDAGLKLRDFSRGWWKLEARDGLALLSDLRMGQEPVYVFSFAVAEQRGGVWRPVEPALALGGRPDLAAAWSWLWRRALGQPLPPPG